MASVSTPGVWPTAMPLHVNKKNVGKSYLEKKALKQIVKGHNKSIISPLHGTLLHCMIFPVLYQVSKQPIRRVIFSRDKSPPIFYFFLFMKWGFKRVQCLAQKTQHNDNASQAQPRVFDPASNIPKVCTVCNIVTFLWFLVYWCDHNQLTLC